MFCFSPAEELVFIMEEGAKEATDSIILKNTLPYSIAFKVHTLHCIIRKHYSALLYSLQGTHITLHFMEKILCLTL